MKTKSHVRFFSRVSHLDADIELVDVIKILSCNGELHEQNETSKNKIFKYVNKQQHPILWERKPNEHNRKIAISHLKSTICESFIKNIYENFTLYLSEILQSAAKNGLNPERLIGEHNVNFTANEVLTTVQESKADGIINLVAKSVFRKLENEKSTKNLLKKFNDKLNLEVSEESINKALPFLEIRHLLVHNDGKVDNKFRDSYPSFNYYNISKKSITLKLDYTLLSAVRDSIYTLVNEFDKKIVDNNIVHKTELQP
ncbi:hypothetical protein [Neisseria sp. HMSC078C12]|uniref:hypothetical protein n=1 Tax=Neisseria sp. HMSC078C12 TaxID=1715075 RepID=UPI0008A93E72|nr:hypothetical protein [Neisseria sp. HMSC078C12]OHR15172.1 hypothetical protein HMPREF2596_07275 [Neisseria sp. HMSC078C12]